MHGTFSPTLISHTWNHSICTQRPCFPSLNMMILRFVVSLTCEQSSAETEMRSVSRCFTNTFPIWINQTRVFGDPIKFPSPPQTLQSQDIKCCLPLKTRLQLCCLSLGWLNGPEITITSRNALSTRPVRTGDLIVGGVAFAQGDAQHCQLPDLMGIFLESKQRLRKKSSLCPMSLWQHVIITASRKKAFSTQQYTSKPVVLNRIIQHKLTEE